MERRCGSDVHQTFSKTTFVSPPPPVAHSHCEEHEHARDSFERACSCESWCGECAAASLPDPFAADGSFSVMADFPDPQVQDVQTDLETQDLALEEDNAQEAKSKRDIPEEQRSMSAGLRISCSPWEMVGISAVPTDERQHPDTTGAYLQNQSTSWVQTPEISQVPSLNVSLHPPISFLPSVDMGSANQGTSFSSNGSLPPTMFGQRQTGHPAAVPTTSQLAPQPPVPHHQQAMHPSQNTGAMLRTGWEGTSSEWQTFEVGLSGTADSAAVSSCSHRSHKVSLKSIGRGKVAPKSEPEGNNSKHDFARSGESEEGQASKFCNAKPAQESSVPTMGLTEQTGNAGSDISGATGHSRMMRPGKDPATMQAASLDDSEKDSEGNPKPKPRPMRKPHYWSKEEHQQFLEALDRFGYQRVQAPNSDHAPVGLGPGMAELISAYMGTRTVAQVRSHAQKHFIRQWKSGNLA